MPTPLRRGYPLASRAPFIAAALFILTSLSLSQIVANGEARTGTYQSFSSLPRSSKNGLVQASGTEFASTGNLVGLREIEDDSKDFEEDEFEEVEERHPGDELLQRHQADATNSYILGGY